jgi:hypothetical protein
MDAYMTKMESEVMGKVERLDKVVSILGMLIMVNGCAVLLTLILHAGLGRLLKNILF